MTEGPCLRLRVLTNDQRRRDNLRREFPLIYKSPLKVRKMIVIAIFTDCSLGFIIFKVETILIGLFLSCLIKCFIQGVNEVIQLFLVHWK